MIFKINQKEREAVKDPIQWLPLTIKTGVQEIAVFLTGHQNAKVNRVKNTSEWDFSYTPTDKEIPHYVDLSLRTEAKCQIQQVWVTLAGRRTRCVICGTDGH
jgi:hypothetical protein